MKETGIIMSGSHPQDIIEGRKTMTRRTWGLEKINQAPDATYEMNMLPHGVLAYREKELYEGGSYWGEWQHIKCPYGAEMYRLC